MAKQKVLKVHSPTADAWDEAVLGFNFEKSLSGYKIDAIAESVEQAILLCEQVNAEHGRALVIKKAKKLQTLFGKLAHELRSMETQKAITSVTTDKELRDLLAFSGAESSLGEAMLNAVRSMQTPFNDYLFTFGKRDSCQPSRKMGRDRLPQRIERRGDSTRSPDICRCGRLGCLKFRTPLSPRLVAGKGA